MNAGAPRAAVRRLTWLLLLSQSLSSAAFITSATVGTLVGAHLSGQTALAGLPGAFHLLGAALAAYPAARLMDRHGRRVGLLVGLALGITGALAAGLAVTRGSFLGFVAAFSLMGSTRGFTDLARYAAAEMHPPAERGRAISLVVLGGTIGAIAGPALVGPAGRVAAGLGTDPLAGPWFASALLFAFGWVFISLLLRPDPRDLAWSVAGGAGISLDAPAIASPSPAAARPWRAILRQPATQLALTAMVIGQLVMVMLMGITALHMNAHGHALDHISLVIMAHTLGMYGLSMVTGRLADRFGRTAVIAAGGGLLALAALLAPLSVSVLNLAVALFLLGLGWNFCYVAGAALLTDSLTVAERGRFQGSSDLTVGLVSALGSVQSGALFAVLGYARLSWLSLVVALLPTLWAGWLVARSAGQARGYAPADGQ